MFYFRIIFNILFIQNPLMKKLLLITILFTGITVQAQLEKAKRLIGVQTNLMAGDISTTPH